MRTQIQDKTKRSEIWIAFLRRNSLEEMFLLFCVCAFVFVLPFELAGSCLKWFDEVKMIFTLVMFSRPFCNSVLELSAQNACSTVFIRMIFKEMELKPIKWMFKKARKWTDLNLRRTSSNNETKYIIIYDFTTISTQRMIYFLFKFIEIHGKSFLTFSI